MIRCFDLALNVKVIMSTMRFSGKASRFETLKAYPIKTLTRVMFFLVPN